MILIFSSVGNVDTDLVIEQLNRSGRKYLRINDFSIFDKETSISIDYNKGINQLILAGHRITPEEITTVWIKKVGLGSYTPYFYDLGNSMENEMKQYQYEEYLSFLQFVFSIFPHSYWPVHPSHLSLNKIQTLISATKAGFNVPETLLTNNLTRLKTFYKDRSEKIITKPFTNGAMLVYDQYTVSLPTQSVDKKSLNELPESFFISKFQDNIPKKYEIRTFFMKGHSYSMAILSQLDAKTSIDYRDYNFEKPNRFLPYKIPHAIERKINKFMKLIRLDTGSLDFIVDTKGEFYFLEVNPFGVFSMIEKRCNYNLPKVIADNL